MNTKEIALKNLYWFTRGKHWGYCQLSTPSDPQKNLDENDWFKLAESMLKDKSNNESFAYKVTKHNLYCVACNFVSSDGIKDDDGRDIPHEFVLVIDENTKLPSDWYVQLHQKLRAVYDELANLPEDDVASEADGINKFLINKIKGKTLVFEFEGDADYFEFVEFEKKTPVTNDYTLQIVLGTLVVVGATIYQLKTTVAVKAVVATLETGMGILTHCYLKRKTT